MTVTNAILLGILFHFIGDYLTQSSWMANVKVQRGWDGWGAAWAHAIVYSIPFALLVDGADWALLTILVTHAIIDHYRLAKYLCWGKNFLAPRDHWPQPWQIAKDNSGYDTTVPVWLSTWLMIITDNTMHIAINSAVIWWVTSR